ncbi:hypothetical protein ABZX75_26500 [Streptomyces sp. NPDC003038]|uniref:hypothetical protein n=1 Tax=unclassified Streptomyces TaxID=2593676 RepID=UPI0033BDE847
MASTKTWQLGTGTAQVFPASGQDIVRPVILVGDKEEGPTDFDQFEAGIDHPSYPFLSELHARGFDLILLGFNNGNASLKDHAKAVQEGIIQANAERTGNDPLIVGGIGRGALAARYALAQMERSKIDHATSIYYSYNGAAPSPEEGETLEQLGSWPMRPHLFKLDSGDFHSELDGEDFHETKAGDPNEDGSLITKELGSWLLDQLR